MDTFDFSSYQKIYLSGICGVSMSAIAKHLISKGKTVGGSDVDKSSTWSDLASLGVKLYQGNLAKNVQDFIPDLIIYSSAVDNKNPELTYAKSKKIPIVKRSVFLGEILKEFKTSIAVSGCHGKTTTTALIGRVFLEGGLNPTVFVGGEDPIFGNYRLGGNQFAIVEACEYKKNFLELKPTISVVLNVDNDHMESYSGMKDMVNCFKEFIRGRISFINADDHYFNDLSYQTSISFGIENNATYTAKNLTCQKNKYSFSFYRNTKNLGRIKLNVFGKHNVYNALVALSIGDLFNIPFSKLKRGVESFYGVKRRLENLGFYSDVEFISDYAHHPKEILCTLSALSVDENDLVVFQPHTYSRTLILMQDFISTLKGDFGLCVYKTYPAREKFMPDGCAYNLYLKLLKEGREKLLYSDNVDELKEIIKSQKKKIKRVIFIGAGDIINVALKILKN